MIVLCRGGGSLEDLWCFNERAVADAVWAASVPVVSGVGHETDTTLADLVADHRAHTPTDAAQTVLPDRRDLEARLARGANYLVAAMDARLDEGARAVARLAERRVLRNADWILGDRARDLDGLRRRGASALRARLGAEEIRLRGALDRLARHSPQARLERWSQRLAAAGTSLEHRVGRRIESAAGRLALAARGLEATSPLAVLGRGYSLTRKAGEAAPLVDAAELAPGDTIETRLGRGRVESTVQSIEADETEHGETEDA